MLVKFFNLCCIAILLCFVLNAAESKKNLELTSFLSPSKYDKTWIDWKNLRLTKAAPNNFVISGDFSLNYYLGDEQQVEIEALRKNPMTNSYATMLSIKKPICKYTSTDTMAYPQIVEHSDLPPAKTCPIPKGDYKLTNFVLDANNIPEYLPNGEYKLFITIRHDTKAVAGLEAVGIIS